VLLPEFGEDLVLALELVLEGSDRAVLGVLVGLTALAGVVEGGGAVVEELLLPEVEEVDGEVVQMSETGFFSKRWRRSRATFCSGLKWRRRRGMDVPPREYYR
jgi:hypothetical protein